MSTDGDRPLRALCQRCEGNGVAPAPRLRIVGPDQRGFVHGIETVIFERCPECDGTGWLPLPGAG